MVQQVPVDAIGPDPAPDAVIGLQHGDGDVGSPQMGRRDQAGHPPTDHHDTPVFGAGGFRASIRGVWVHAGARYVRVRVFAGGDVAVAASRPASNVACRTHSSNRRPIYCHRSTGINAADRR